MSRLFTLILLSCLIIPAFADERANTQRQLDAARKEVLELKRQLSKLQQERSSVQRQLRNNEVEIGNLENQIKDLQQELKNSQVELKKLDEDKKKLQSARVEQQRLIAVQARAAYQNGRQEYVELLLNQQQPEQLSRTLTYYEYLNNARLKQITAFNETLSELARVEQEINAHQKQLTDQKAELDKRVKQLAEVRKQRQQALARANSQYSDRNQRLKAREQDQAKFAQVLRTIEQTLARQQAEAAAAAAAARQQAQASASSGGKKPVSPGSSGPVVSSGAVYGGPFASARGKLPWPVNGRVVARFGTPRSDDTRTKWDGVLIGATAGTQVRAVHGGRVVFADWLRGAGLLVILDHGGGYLTLYGHNQSLLKNAGDLVKAGEPIATVGNSGGQQQPGLYFAIRQSGKPSDPALWCRTQG